MTIKNKVVLAAALFVIAALAMLIFSTSGQTSEPPLPDPNGYDDFLKAGALLGGNESVWTDGSIEELRSMVATNGAALELIRVGLTKQCRVVPYLMTATTNNHLNDLAASKRIAHAFAAASKLALLDGQTNEAAMLALDCIRYGIESTRGGVIIDALVGIANQSIGRARLEDALPGTDVETARKIITSLEDAISKREPCADFFTREARWARLGRFGSSGILAQLIQPFFQGGTRAKIEQKFIKTSNDLHGTKLRAAAHAYEMEHGQPPVTARDLVPLYLKSIPLDPATGQKLPLN